MSEDGPVAPEPASAPAPAPAHVPAKDVGLKVALLVVGALLTIISTVAVIYLGSLSEELSKSNEERDAQIDTLTATIIEMDKTQALMQKTLDGLTKGNKILDGHQNQLSKQWGWLGTLHDEMNRQRFKESLPALVRPQKPTD